MRPMIHSQHLLSIIVLLAVLVLVSLHTGLRSGSHGDGIGRGVNHAVTVCNAAAHDVSPSLAALAPFQNGNDAIQEGAGLGSGSVLPEALPTPFTPAAVEPLTSAAVEQTNHGTKAPPEI